MLVDIQAVVPQFTLALGGHAAAALPVSVGTASPSSPSWLPVAGAAGAVLGAIIAGVIGFVSSRYTLRKQHELTELTLRQQRDATRETLDQQRKATEASLEHQRAQLFNERFAVAADKLGHAQAATRLAGVYAMAGLADEWNGQQQTCIDVLCGYMRMPYQPIQGETGYREGEREVRYSLIRIIRDHLRDGALSSWQKRYFRFHRAYFDGGDFSRIRMSGGYMSFYRAEFACDKVDFRGAMFSAGTIDFYEAQFSAGTIDFRHAKFSGGDAKFSGATFIGCIVDFRDAVFSGGKIDFRDAAFSGGTVDLSQALFSGGTVDLSNPKDKSVPPKYPVPPPAWIRLA